ncbi:MAG: signal peptidase II [Rickettsiales bacterium]|nr:signal peptidase II [Rickettsiales bacterium]
MLIRGIIIALFCIFLDQAHKYYMLEIYNMPEKKLVIITSFYNNVMVWNKGISFGLFQEFAKSNYFFLTTSSIIILLLCYFLSKAKTNFEMTGFATIIGGAVGNIIDRLRFGAVADFFDFHYKNYHWPAFNIADSCIFIGACVLIIYSLFFENKNETK